MTPQSKRATATLPADARYMAVGDMFMAVTESEARLVARLALRYAISEDAVSSVLRALKASGGVMAQFSHPEFGGMSQWSGGMTMIGDMFNEGLKAKLDAIASELSAYVRADPGSGTGEIGGGVVLESKRSPWWPAELGTPSAVGGQNSFRYAVFPDRRRLLIDEDGDISIYDTGEHQISGISQTQAGTGSIHFSSSAGSVSLSELRRVES
jgi:hypothetical protein